MEKQSSTTGMIMVKEGIKSHQGKYVEYNVLGNMFQVTSKYAPPIYPVGRGAYGIVWSVSPSILSYSIKL